MQWPTTDQINSGLRHVYTATATGTAVAVLIGLSQGQATALGVAVHQIGDGIASIIAGVSTLISVGSAAYAMWSASPFSRMLAVSKDPQTEKLEVKSKALADALPPNVVVAK